jgi:TonB family protein
LLQDEALTMPSTPAQTRHTRGVFVVILLGVIFFTLLAMLIITTGRKHSEATPQTETLTVLTQRLRIRTEPNAKAPVVATASAGDQLVLLEDHGQWVRVQAADGLSGWAERGALERTIERDRRLGRYAAIRKLPPLRGVATGRTVLYSGPGIFYPVIGELPAHSDVRVFTRDHDFYAIDSQGQVAYVDVDAIDVSGSGTPQLEVRTTSTGPAPTETTASVTPPTETATPVMPPTEMPPQPAPAPEPVRTDRGGVYSVVPAGGTQPEEIERVVPRYPGIARRAGVYGPVVIRGIVRRDGTIDNVEVIKDLPYGLGEAAREAVEQWRFRPATYRGEPIDVYYTVTVNFRLQ